MSLKRKGMIVLAAVVAVVMAGVGLCGGHCAKESKGNMKMNEEKAGMFGLGQPNDAYAKYFVGKSYLNILTKDGMVVANVTFEPGCRNNWHVHHAKTGGGQILLVTSGRGFVQEWGKPAQEVKAGDAVQIPAGVKHWHGAAADSWFAHIALEVPGEETSNEWLEPVSDEEYAKVNAGVEKTSKIVQTAGRQQLGEFAPMFAHLNDDVLFGEVWNDDTISLKTRSLITVVSLMASGITDSSLKYHLENAKKNGVTQAEMAAAITHATMYVGWPKGWAVFRMAKEVYGE